MNTIDCSCTTVFFAEFEERIFQLFTTKLPKEILQRIFVLLKTKVKKLVNYIKIKIHDTYFGPCLSEQEHVAWNCQFLFVEKKSVQRKIARSILHFLASQQASKLQEGFLALISPCLPYLRQVLLVMLRDFFADFLVGARQSEQKWHHPARLNYCSVLQQYTTYDL